MTKSDQKFALIGRPCVQIDVPCPSCGHSNDLCKVSMCTICDQSLVGKGGRLEVKSSVSCPSCGSKENQL